MPEGNPDGYPPPGNPPNPPEGKPLEGGPVGVAPEGAGCSVGVEATSALLTFWREKVSQEKLNWICSANTHRKLPSHSRRGHEEGSNAEDSGELHDE